MNEKERVLSWIDEHHDDILTTLKELINIPSVNPWFGEATELSDEKGVQAYIADKMKKLGAEVEQWEPNADALREYEGRAGYYPGRDFTNRPNLAATFKGEGDGNSLLLFGHIDVVKEGSNWTKPAFAAEISDGKLYGRGAVDMKGGVASMISAVEALKKTNVPLKGDVVVGTVVDEEAGGMGALDFIAQGYRTDGCILTEPTSLQIAPLCRGILWGKLIIKGRAGHIEMPKADWKDGGAVDAIEKAKLVMKGIDELNEKWSVEKTHPLLPIPCQIYLAQIQGGEYPTAYANRVEITFNAQYLPSERDANLLGGKVKEEIETLMKKVAEQDSWLQANPVKIEWLIDADCAETDSEHPFVQQCAHSLEQLDRKPVIEGLCFHTDMGWPVNVGIPTINFGPGDPRMAHHSDEFVPVDEVIEATKVIALTMIDWCKVKEESD
ncbi:ArgE/DapE family deacylase [Halalkalibacter oceani]|uniref:Probable succinyl-diaminopimelate desuccinylase n=1 Tax=Halalkalibacter oceani TaxID=1653776 RepID=A0A9X2DQP2_9BACI|nr:ArgE/DapE family deacylase [Halalkalibacter oceani]MCM3715299.1 ArgE/DapE family deacylase [Halalkalibacter oceani]